MGQALAAIGKQSRVATVEQRIEKISSQAKPAVHPLYPTEQKVLNQIRVKHPELTEKINERRPQLEENIRQLRVTSSAVFRTENQNSNGKEQNSNRSLPRYRLLNPDTDHGFHDSITAPSQPGKIRFRRFLELMQKAYDEKASCSKSDVEISRLAVEFDLSLENMKSIINYYLPFEHNVGYRVLNIMDMKQYIGQAPKQTPEQRQDFIETEASNYYRGMMLSELQQKHMQKILEQFEDAKKKKLIGASIDNPNEDPSSSDKSKSNDS